MDNSPLFLEMDKPTTGTRWAITDIHACPKTFRALVESLELTEDDQLFLLGDYVGRGPDDKGVLDFILELKAEGKQVYATKGNHDEWMLESWKRYKKNENAYRDWSKSDLLDDTGSLAKPYEEFFENLVFYIKLPDFYLVHAGFQFRKPNPFENYKRMTMISRIHPDLELLEGRRIVHGHRVFTLEEIQQTIDQQETVIHLDNGCYRHFKAHYGEEYGHLLALNLDTFELKIQNCLDEKPNKKQ